MLCIIHHKSKDNFLINHIDIHKDFAKQLEMETIVIEDGVENRKEISLFCRDKKVSYECTGKERRNPAHSRNLGISWSNNRTLFLDTEIVPSEGVMLNVIRAVSAKPKSVICFSVMNEQKDGSLIEIPRGGHGFFESYDSFTSGAFYLYKPILPNDCYFNLDFYGYGYEDCDFAYRCKIRNIPVFIYTMAKFIHRYHDRSIKRNEDELRNRSLYIQNQKRYLKDLKTFGRFIITTGPLRPRGLS